MSNEKLTPEEQGFRDGLQELIKEEKAKGTSIVDIDKALKALQQYFQQIEKKEQQ